ncbi:MAG: inorganic phosphate transporter [Deltaproteobacteria bacterium]|jgi:PiT family inorganic phosphate transporter|nr:inorganic phosphate transporter [Deltaproteobacteria bacterium]
MFEIPLLLLVIIITALVFDFTNGAHDCANAIATVVSTKVLSPRAAVAMAAILNLTGALLGTEVAHTLGAGIVRPDIVSGSHILVLAGLIGAIFWNSFTWYFGIPSSSSHALIGGLIGAAFAHAGFDALNALSIVKKVLLPLALSPLAGFCAGVALMSLIIFVFHRVRRQTANGFFRRAQVFSAGTMALSHGLNDAQKTMGVITLALLIFGQIDSIVVPLWVKLACSLAMAAGTSVGGWKIVKTMGHKIFKLEPAHGFAAETSAALVIAGASMLGAPVSTTHTITACIFGVGSTKRLSAVRWGVAGNLLVAWVLTIPAAATVGALAFLLLDRVF